MNVYPNILGSTKSGNTYTPAAGIRLDRGYEYDLMGSVVKERDRTPASAASQGPGSIERVFGHDPLRRLLSATGRESTVALVQPSWDLNVRPQDYTATNTYTRSYTYDRLGNIQTLRHVANGIPANNFTRRYNYPNGFGSNMLEAMGIGASTYPYTYDASGNQTKENTDRYFEWNYGDKLSFYKRQAGSSSPTVWSHYFYDASGQRIKKVVNKPGGIQEMTVYIDGVFEHTYLRINNNVDNNRNYNTLHILDASSGLSAGGGSRIATLRVGNDSQDSTPALKYYVKDHLVNSSVSVQSNGNRINLEEYYPFGETSYGSFAKKRYRYNGKEKDDHTGLYEYGQRYYAPWLCRFVSVDPMAHEREWLSPYNFVQNSPINRIDPDGALDVAASPPDDHYINNDGSIQSVKTDDNFDRFYVQSNTSETGYDLAGQLNKNDAGLVEFPASGTTFSRYGTSDAGGTSTSPLETVGQGDHYLQPGAAAALFGLVNKLNTDFGFNVSLGDMSSSNGSDPWQAGFKHHAGHGHLGKRSGLDVDFRYLNNNGQSFQSSNAFNNSSFSTLNNQRVYDAAAIFGFTKNYQGTSGSLTGVTRVGGHNDHGHLGLQYKSLNWKYVPSSPEIQQLDGFRLFKR